MQCVWHWSLKPLLTTVSIMLEMVTITFVYCLCFVKALWERIAWRWYWFLLCVFLRLAGLLSLRCSCARPSEAVHIYNNVKYRELKQAQVTCSFAPPGAPGQSTQCGWDSHTEPPARLHSWVQCCGSEDVSSKLNFNAAWLPEGWPSVGLVSLTLERGLTHWNFSIICWSMWHLSAWGTSPY